MSQKTVQGILSNTNLIESIDLFYKNKPKFTNYELRILEHELFLKVFKNRSSQMIKLFHIIDEKEGITPKQIFELSKSRKSTELLIFSLCKLGFIKEVRFGRTRVFLLNKNYEEINQMIEQAHAYLNNNNNNNNNNNKGEYFFVYLSIFKNQIHNDKDDNNNYNNYNNKMEYLHEIVKMPDELKTSIKQYLIFFNDFVKTAKGKIINLEVLSNTEGLELILQINSEDQIDDINKYLSEYIGFVKKNINDLQVTIENEITKMEANLLIVDLRNQIRFLQSSLENKNLENIMLKQQSDGYYNLLEIKLKNPQPITFLATQNNNVSVDIISKIKLIQSDFNKFSSEVSKLDEDLEDELETIEKSLLEINSESEQNKIKVAINNLSIFLMELGDESSKFNKIVKGSKNAIKLIQKICNNYNKLAKLLGIQQVPHLFIGNEENLDK